MIYCLLLKRGGGQTYAGNTFADFFGLVNQEVYHFWKAPSS